MTQIKKKMNRKIDRSAAYLITDYRLLITAMLLPAALLSGCMGIYEGGFECPAGTGVGCKSISDVNEMVNQGVLPHNSSTSASDFESHRPKCENCGRSFLSNQEKAGIWINPLYLKESPTETQEKKEEKKKNFIEPPHQYIREEFKREKGHHDTISL